MATEQQKHSALAELHAKATIADQAGLPATAQGWRDRYHTVMERPAQDIIIAARPGAEAKE